MGARRLTRWALVATLCAALTPALAVAGQSSAGPTEYQVKASMLYNFQLYTEWPAEAPAGMNLCVLGKDPFGEELGEMAGRPARGAALTVRVVAAADEAAECHLVFIARSEYGRLAGILQALQQRPILTISDMEGSAARGVMIELFMEARHVAFRINLAAARQAGLRISSQVLKLAREVY